MIKIFAYENLGRANHGWLDARYHFSFAPYFDSSKVGFGNLRVINDDIVKAGAGFQEHAHRDMEIITFVRQGAITHRDSAGNIGKTKAGDVQVMSAGSGISHSELNLENEDTNLYQIWIKPRENGLKPSWNSCEFPKEVAKKELNLLVAGNSSAPLQINQDAFIYAGNLQEGVKIAHKLKLAGAYFLVSQGEVEINGLRVKKGDGAEITEIELLEIKTLSAAQVLVIEV